MLAVPDLPSITIVTPSFNAVATIGATLESVRCQAYPGLEHIVVDGGSTDGTLEILEAARGIRYVSEPDRGLAHALNKGIAMASGNVVGELNADDVYEPGSLSAVGEAFRDHPGAAWLTGYCRIIDGDGVEIRRAVTAYKNALLRRYSLGLYLTHNFISAPATFFRREALDEAGGFDERYRISVDYDLQLRIARRHDPLILRRYLASFRMVEGTLSMSGFEAQFREHAEQARRHGNGHRLAVALNRGISAGIVGTYGVMRRVRERLSEHARHRRDWSDLGELDPMWAIASTPEKRFHGWDEAAFAESGARKAAGVLRRLEELGVPARHGRALDFGCGIGRLSLPLAGSFETVLGVDIAPSMIEAARARAAEAGVTNARFLVDGEMRLEPASFDLVYSVLVVQHQPSTEAALGLIRRLATAVGPGGVLVVQVPTRLSPRLRLQPGRRIYSLLRGLGVPPRFLYERLKLQPMRMVAVPRGRVDACLREAGLREVRADERERGGVRSMTLYAIAER